MGLTNKTDQSAPAPDAARTRALFWAAVIVAGALVFLGVVTLYGSGDSREAADRALDARNSEEDAECRADWGAWVQEARDKASEGAGVVTRGIKRALVALEAQDDAAFKAALELADRGDRQIERWAPVIEERREAYRVVLESQRLGPEGTAARGLRSPRAWCSEGPPS